MPDDTEDPLKDVSGIEFLTPTAGSKEIQQFMCARRGAGTRFTGIDLAFGPDMSLVQEIDYAGVESRLLSRIIGMHEDPRVSESRTLSDPRDSALMYGQSSHAKVFHVDLHCSKCGMRASHLSISLYEHEKICTGAAQSE